MEQWIRSGDSDSDISVHGFYNVLKLTVNISRVAWIAWTKAIMISSCVWDPPRAVRISVLVEPAVPSSNMLRVVRMDTGENKALPDWGSTRPLSTRVIVKFQMELDALKAGVGSGAWTTLKAFLTERPVWSEPPNLMRTSVMLILFIKSSIMVSKGLGFGLGVVVDVVENWNVFQSITSSKRSSSKTKFPLVRSPPPSSCYNNHVLFSPSK